MNLIYDIQCVHIHSSDVEHLPGDILWSGLGGWAKSLGAKALEGHQWDIWSSRRRGLETTKKHEAMDRLGQQMINMWLYWGFECCHQTCPNDFRWF